MIDPLRRIIILYKKEYEKINIRYSITIYISEIYIIIFIFTDTFKTTKTQKKKKLKKRKKKRKKNKINRK